MIRGEIPICQLRQLKVPRSIEVFPAVDLFCALGGWGLGVCCRAAQLERADDDDEDDDEEDDDDDIIIIVTIMIVVIIGMVMLMVMATVPWPPAIHRFRSGPQQT